MQDLNDKVTGGTLTAAEWNEVPSELQNVIEGLGITLSGGDLNQLGKAIAGYVAHGDFYTDSGIADAYVLSVTGSKQAPPEYVNGFMVRFNTSNPNTGASTVNVATLGVKNIKDQNGNDPDLGTINRDTVLIYDGTDFIVSGPGLIGVKTTAITVSNPTFTPDASTKAIEFIAIAAGGGGGGIDGQGAASAASSASGAAGGTAIATQTPPDSTYNITIGAGGTGGAAGNNAGSTGGATTVVSTNLNLSANGGDGGLGMLGSSASIGTVGSDGGTASGGDINIIGGDSSGGRVVTGEVGCFSISGSSYFGGGGKTNNAATGDVGSAPGSGGGGVLSADSATNFAGGDGADGIVVVKEFF